MVQINNLVIIIKIIYFIIIIMAEHMAEMGMTAVNERCENPLDDMYMIKSYINDDMNPINNKYNWKVCESGKSNINNNPSMYIKQMTQLITTPWGSETIITGHDTSPTKVKFYSVKPEHHIPEATHKHRNEHIIITNGVAELTFGNDKMILSKNSSFFIPSGMKHFIKNASSINSNYLEFYEIQIGNITEEGYNLCEFDI